MKKRVGAAILSVILAIAMTFAFYGCGAESGASDGNDGEWEDNKEITTMYMYIDGDRREVSLAGNSATKELTRRLEQGDIIYTADDYGGFEKVGAFGGSLPESNSRITTQPGDVMLYQGSQIVVFYGSNTWAYTPIGRIQGLTSSQLRDFLGAGRGEIQVRLSLN